jgi:hypothetical protein
MESFCNSLDPRYLDKLSKESKEEIKEIVNLIDPEIIPKDRRHVSYILSVYFSPKSIKSFVDTKKGLTTEKLCSFLSSTKFKPSEIELLFYSVYNAIINAGLSPSLENLKEKYLVKLFTIIDDVYFDSIIQRKMKEGKLKLELKVSTRFSRLAGRCSKEIKTDGKERSCFFMITMAKDLFSDPFLKKGLKSQVSNGIEYYNPLSTFISTLQHEMIHLVIMDFCPTLDAPGGHSDTFKLISKRLFGHTEHKHLLGVDVELFGVTKEELAKRMRRGEAYIKILLADDKKVSAKGGEVTIAKIEKLNPKKVKVKIGKLLWSIPYTYVLKEEVTKEEIASIPKDKDYLSNLISKLGKEKSSDSEFNSESGKNGWLTNEQVTKINEQAKEASRRRTFVKGERVTYQDGSHKEDLFTGIIERVNKTTVTVREPGSSKKYYIPYDKILK